MSLEAHPRVRPALDHEVASFQNDAERPRPVHESTSESNAPCNFDFHTGRDGLYSSSYNEMRLCRNARIHTPKSIVMYKNRNPSRVACNFLAFRARSASLSPTVSRVLKVGDRFSGTGASTSTFAGCPMVGRLCGGTPRCPGGRPAALWRHASLPFGVRLAAAELG